MTRKWKLENLVFPEIRCQRDNIVLVLFGVLDRLDAEEEHDNVNDFNERTASILCGSF